ncbi:MAG: ABC transporter ATP-binding protein [Synechococcaceae cyanobacterium]|nr:ABC transporter ATP-binding protein [Synechococcaceae cyanobacterium]
MGQTPLDTVPTGRAVPDSAVARKPLPGLRSETFVQLRQLLSYLPRKRLQGLLLLLLVAVAVGLLDLLFVGLLARLVGALSGARMQNRIPLIVVFGGGRADQAIWMSSILIALVWLSSGLRFLMTYMQAFLSAQVWADYGNLIYTNILYQSLEYFQNQRSSHLLARLNLILSQISDRIILPLLAFMASVISAGVLTIGIIIALGPAALMIFVLLFVAYALLSILIIPPLRLASKQKIRFSVNVNAVLMESIRSIRDVQLYGAEPYFANQFSEIGVRGKRYDRIARLLPEIPRFVIEPAGITILFAVCLMPAIIDGSHQSLKQSIPTIAAVMFAALKLSAPIQTIFRSINRFRGGLPEISDALLLLQLEPGRRLMRQPSTPSPAGLMPKNVIKLEKVWYRYPQSEDWVIQGIDLLIPVGSRVALVGRTGGGKTTAAHLLLGLFQPQRGAILLDGIALSEAEIPAWQACCAMVPQQIVLLDASIRENVAFGIGREVIEDDEVWEALEAAQLAEFVADLPYGLYTVIGENGLRLSGGQRQRLALARAFFKRADVLVLDEATSALDNKTESEVMDALELIARRCTTVVIAHRLSTVKNCDRIYEFENGRIKAYGNYEELQERSPSFRELVFQGHG